MKIPTEIKEKIIKISENNNKEVCGCVTKEGKKWEVIEFDNIEKSSFLYVPEQNQYYEVIINTDIFNPNSKRKLIAFFHSHPEFKAEPSIFDKKYMKWDVLYVIYSPAFKEFKVFDKNGIEVKNDTRGDK